MNIRRFFALTAVAGGLFVVVCCGGGGSLGGGAPDGSVEASPGDDAGVTDATKREAAAPPDAEAPFACKAGAPRVLRSIGLDDAGKTRSWLAPMRLLRLSSTLARALVHATGEAPSVLTFDPSAATLAIAATTPLPMDRILDVSHEDGALYVYGLRLDALGDGGVSASLVLVSIDDTDATGTATIRTLTMPGAVTGEGKDGYEPPTGRFVRFGTDDVYFTYTQELFSANNPSYRLSVGRVSAGSGPVGMTVVATAGAHNFENITAAGLVHAASSVFLFTGASAIRTQSDGFSPAAEWTLPDDGTTIATIPSRSLGYGLLATSRDGTLERYAFVEVPLGVFTDPRKFLVATSTDATVATFVPDATDKEVGDPLARQIAAETHFEGDQVLWFGPKGGVWVDATSKKLRASFEAPNPYDGSFTPPGAGAAAFETPPTATSATIDVVFAEFAPTGEDVLYFAAVVCGR